jgi:hypothetical protein
MRRLRLLFFLFFLASIADALALAPAATQENGAAPIAIGHSVVPLYGPWKFTVGDSPVDPVTRAPLWAEPGFDDSNWETVDLTPKQGAIDPIVGLPGYVPGWTSKGHPGYWGYAWYRIRVRLAMQPGESLALGGPADVDDAYQAFANGHLLGSFGDFSASQPAVYFTQPRMFQVRLRPVTDAGSGAEPLSLAFRVWMEPNTLHEEPAAGGFHTAPLVGDAATVAAEYRIRWLEIIRSDAIRPLQAALFLLLAVVAFSLRLFDRSDRVYLWMGAVFLQIAAVNFLSFLSAWTQTMSIVVELVCVDVFLIPFGYLCWVMVWWIWFGLRRPTWTPRAAAILMLILMISTALGEDLFPTVVPQPVSAVFYYLSLAVLLAFFATLVGIVVLGIRQQGREGWLALPAVLLIGVSEFFDQLILLHIPTIWFPFGLQLSLTDCADLFLAVVISLLLLRRLLNSVRRQRVMALDVKQAQEVQRVILPEARVLHPGLTIESVYRPAREVGGDFFQIIPHSMDGSLLIVAGDVAGKGLPAGMLVALLVGAIRSTVELNSDPEFVLSALNRRLMGRGDAAATCLAVRIAADGSVTLANAGHVPPYLNGVPVLMDGALPLGMMEGAEHSVMRFTLEPDDRLVLLSDGILEAMDADGQLFGFERIDELLRGKINAVEMADAAQRFGQEDDISVISVTSTRMLEIATA